MATPLISVILPFYNAESTLERAIASIQQQTCKDWELLTVDDGSTDDSRSIVEQLAKLDSRIHIVGKDHRGIVGALQQGCAAASGHFLARMDADDFSMPLRFERQRAFMEENPKAGLCGVQVKMVGGKIGEGRQRYENWLNSMLTPALIQHDLLVECPIAHPAFFMRRECFETVGGYQDHGWPEDYDLVMRVALSEWQLGNVPEVLLEWHDIVDRLSMRDPRYEEASFRAIKRHYLMQSHLKGAKTFYQWGAGEVGKRWLREWTNRKPEAVVDIHPRKIGKRIHDIDVIAPEDLPEAGTTFIVIAVGAPGARREIRDWLNPRGYREGVEYCFIA